MKSKKPIVSSAVNTIPMPISTIRTRTRPKKCSSLFSRLISRSCTKSSILTQAQAMAPAPREAASTQDPARALMVPVLMGQVPQGAETVRPGRMKTGRPTPTMAVLRISPISGTNFSAPTVLVRRARARWTAKRRSIFVPPHPISTTVCSRKPLTSSAPWKNAAPSGITTAQPPTAVWATTLSPWSMRRRQFPWSRATKSTGASSSSFSPGAAGTLPASRPMERL